MLDIFLHHYHLQPNTREYKTYKNVQKKKKFAKIFTFIHVIKHFSPKIWPHFKHAGLCEPALVKVSKHIVQKNASSDSSINEIENKYNEYNILIT